MPCLRCAVAGCRLKVEGWFAIGNLQPVTFNLQLEICMVLGVDFDNTIVRYDDVFHRVAVERGLIPDGVAPRKNEVRGLSARAGSGTGLDGTPEAKCTGRRMAEAQPFPGWPISLPGASGNGVPVITSSAIRPRDRSGAAIRSAKGARDWLAAKGFFDPRARDCHRNTSILV